MIALQLRLLLHRHWPVLGVALLTSLALVHSPAFGKTTVEEGAMPNVNKAQWLLTDNQTSDEPSCEDSDGDGECDPEGTGPKD